ncbi:strawberry notch C-terminal domain-containing protein, partial [Acinetobacter baumannii]
MSKTAEAGLPADIAALSFEQALAELDQIVQRFGTDMVAEVTGRSRRVVRKRDRLIVENRAA